MSIWRVYDALENILEEGSNAAAEAHDGDTSTYYTIYNPYYGDFFGPYAIEEDFGQTVTVTQFRVYVTNANPYNYAKIFYWTGSEWVLAGIANINNSWNTVSGSWTTSKWRVVWDGVFYGEVSFGSFVRINEMQAVQAGGAQTLTVSDTGTGTDRITNRTLLNLSDTGAGTDRITNRTLLNLRDTGNGVEFASLSGNLVTITDSGSGAETAVSIPHIFVTDSGWGNEASTPIVTFYLTDTGEGAEDLLMDLEVYDASSLSGEEIALVLGQTDEGLGTDGLPLRLVGVSDDGTGQETSTLIVIANDNGVGRELAVVTNLLSASDEGSGLEKPLRVIHIGAFVFLRPD
jgi:hypothetical protein